MRLLPAFAILALTTACSREAEPLAEAPVAAVKTEPAPLLEPADAPTVAAAPARRPQLGPAETLEEMRRRSGLALRRADADRDGAISSAELQAAQAAGQRGAARWARADLDGDGRITSQEIDTVLARQFARLDADGDGRVTSAERQARRAAAAD